MCASLKEEFGIALLEAMATGLMVVAPDGGGPATYVQDGVTGVLTQTWDPARLEAGDRRGPRCGRRWTTTAGWMPRTTWCATNFTIQAMATALGPVYRGVAVEEAELLRGRAGVSAVTLLVISPDYASHLLPLATLATAWRDAGERVVVATGPATDPIVREFGLERYDLPLGRGSNARVIRADDQPDEEADSLRGFFDATRRGMVPTLSYQASERLTDLMWEPVDAGRRTLAAVEAVRPDAILIDHLAFSARLALQTAGIPFGDVVLGHPTALPVDGEVYGYPPFWPAAFRAGRRASSPTCGRSATRCRRASPRSGTAPRAPSIPARRDRRRVRRARRSRALQLPRGAGRGRWADAATARLPRIDAARRAGRRRGRRLDRRRRASSPT